MPRRSAHTTTLSADALAYPVLVMAPGGVLYRAAGPDTLQRCNKEAWRRRYFDSVQVLDGEGRLLEAAAAGEPRVVKGGLRWLIGNPILQVRLTLAQVGTLSLGEAKERLEAIVQRDPHLWEAVEDVGDAIARFRAAATLTGLIALFVEL